MATYGRTVLGTVGGSFELTADGRPEQKVAGVTIDWNTVAAYAGADMFLPDGIQVTAGDKYIRYGQVLTQITASGKYGPYDPAAADGRQTLTKGLTFLANRTVKQNDRSSDHGVEAIDGGRIYRNRLLATAGAHSLAAGPTYAEIEAVLPRMNYVFDDYVSG